jgi:hypothetical protein
MKSTPTAAAKPTIIQSRVIHRLLLSMMAHVTATK